MNLALLGKTLRDSWTLLSLALLGILVFEVFFVRAISEFAVDLLEMWEKRPILKNMIQMLIGAKFNVNISPTGLVTIGMAHPVIFTLTWAFILTTASRVLAGELDRGTADLLLTLPVSRARIYATVSAATLAPGVLFSAAPVAGIALGERIFPLAQPLELERLMIPAWNLLALYLAVASVALFVSTLTVRRGLVVAAVLSGLIVSFALNFLSQFWSGLNYVLFLSIMDYYRPLASVIDGAWPVQNLCVLVGVAVTAWLAGLWQFSRRDVPAP